MKKAVTAPVHGRRSPDSAVALTTTETEAMQT
jgi:hypothetical protein